MTCSVSDNCLNSDKCFHCCYDEDRYSEFGKDLYNPIISKNNHPIKEEILAKNRQKKLQKKNEIKKEKQELRKIDKVKERESKDKSKQKLLKKASKTEDLVKSTINSGRQNMDADLKATDLVIDIKLQSTSKDWHIKHDEFIKVQNDAKRGNRQYGVLTLVNKDNESVCVIPTELFTILLEYMEN